MRSVDSYNRSEPSGSESSQLLVNTWAHQRKWPRANDPHPCIHKMELARLEPATSGCDNGKTCTIGVSPSLFKPFWVSPVLPASLSLVARSVSRVTQRADPDDPSGIARPRCALNCSRKYEALPECRLDPYLQESALAEREACESSGSTLSFLDWLNEVDPLPKLRVPAA